MKKALKIIGIVLAAIIVIVAGYLAYVFISYHRIGDQPIDVKGTAQATIGKRDRLRGARSPRPRAFRSVGGRFRILYGRR